MSVNTDLLIRNPLTPFYWGAYEAYRQLNFLGIGNGEFRFISDEGIFSSIRNGPMSAHDFRLFLQEYRLYDYGIQYMSNIELSVLSSVLHNIYRQYQPNRESIHVLWWRAIEQTQALSPRNIRMQSLCSKLLWFYFPNEMAIYDGCALTGLGKFLGRSLPKVTTEGYAKSFINGFNRCFCDNMHKIEASIDALEDIVQDTYQYPRRVMDKVLWFRGAKKERQQEVLSKLEDTDIHYTAMYWLYYSVQHTNP